MHYDSQLICTLWTCSTATTDVHWYVCSNMPLILGNNLSSEYQLLVTVIVIVIRAEMKYLPLDTYRIEKCKCYNINAVSTLATLPRVLSQYFLSQYEVRTTTDPAAYPLKPMYIYNFVKVFSYTPKDVLWIYYIEYSVAVLFPSFLAYQYVHILVLHVLSPYLLSPIILYYSERSICIKSKQLLLCNTFVVC